MKPVCAAMVILCLLSFAMFAQQAASQKVIKDPAEYNAYIAALTIAAPAQKAAAMEKFIAQYPESIVRDDAMEQAMAAYQQQGDTARVIEKARQLVGVHPEHVRALAIITAI